MSNQFQINVLNLSNSNQSFFLFQQQSKFTSSGTQLETKSSSLAQGLLSPNKNTGAALHLKIEKTTYAGAIIPASSLSSIQPAIMANNYASLVTSTTSAAQQIQLASNNPGAKCKTELKVDPFGLSLPSLDSSVPQHSFRIAVPSYHPKPHNYLCGLAIVNTNASVVLSNFTAATPVSNIDCTRKWVFYIAVGSYQAGEIIDYSSCVKNACKCDFTQGYSTFKVEYQADGKFTCTGSTP